MRATCVLAVLTSALILAPSRDAAAAQVIVSFDDLRPTYTGSIFHNVTSGGFRVSPGCHIDLLAFPQPYGGWTPSTSDWVAWDGSGCFGGLNPNFLGQTVAGLPTTTTSLFIDHEGEAFSILSFDLGMTNGFAGGRLISSKGGQYVVPFIFPTVGTIALSGNEWRDIDWLLFRTDLDTGAPGMAIDNLVMDASTAGTLPLLAVAGLAFALSRRRARGGQVVNR